jgi:hypothetical protein
MTGILAIARQTFSQCLRMKLAAVFIVLLAASLLVLPFTMEGDGTLNGRVKTFLNYSTSVTAGLMIVATVFLSVAVIADDVRTHRIYSIAVKPISRPSYVAGRWLGVVMLNAMVLCVAWVVIYGMVMYLRGGKELNPDDRRALETEVLTARREVLPEPIDVTADVRKRIKEMQETGDYQNAIQNMLEKAGGEPAIAEEMLLQELHKQAMEARQSTGPGGTLSWTFDDIRVRGSETSADGKVTRAGANMDGKFRLLRIEVPRYLLGRLVHEGPVEVEGLSGRVWNIGEGFFDAAIDKEDVSAIGDPLGVGKTVAVTAPPTIQFSFKANASTLPQDKMLYALWQIGPSGGLKRGMLSKDPFATKVTTTLSADVVDPNGQTVIRFRNLRNPRTGAAPSVLILREDISVLYRIGAFEPNLFRGMLLTLLQVMYVAALGVLAGSALSFPVATLLCFFVLPFGLARGWISKSVVPLAGTELDDFFTQLGRYIFYVMRILLPDLENASAAEVLTDGMYIPWGMGVEGEVGVLGAALPTLLRIAVCMAAGFVIFQKRELAKVQV